MLLRGAIVVGLNLKLMRSEGFAKTGAVQLGHRDMCGKCWGRGCEFGKHLRRPA